jgi:hypothetical protein
MSQLMAAYFTQVDPDFDCSFARLAARGRTGTHNGVHFMSNGVIFLASDSVIHLAVPFLRSFRRFNPGLPLCLIPFDTEISWLKSLQTTYDFTIFNNAEVLKWCDELSVNFHGHVHGQYRKLACWHTDFDSFVYVDVDTIILSELSFCFHLLAGFDFLTSHSDLPQIRRWVWRDSIREQSKLCGRQISFSANTGYIVSKAGLLSRSQVLYALPEALSISDHMELSTIEQPFLNFLIVTSSAHYSSLRTLARIYQRTDIPQEHWGGHEEPESCGGVVTEMKPFPVLLIHWAGVWRHGVHLRSKLWQFYSQPDLFALSRYSAVR